MPSSILAATALPVKRPGHKIQASYKTCFFSFKQKAICLCCRTRQLCTGLGHRGQQEQVVLVKHICKLTLGRWDVTVAEGEPKTVMPSCQSSCALVNCEIEGRILPRPQVARGKFAAVYAVWTDRVGGKSPSENWTASRWRSPRLYEALRQGGGTGSLRERQHWTRAVNAPRRLGSTDKRHGRCSGDGQRADRQAAGAVARDSRTRDGFLGGSRPGCDRAPRGGLRTAHARAPFSSGNAGPGSPAKEPRQRRRGRLRQRAAP